MLNEIRESELYQVAVDLNVLIDEIANNEKAYAPAASVDRMLHAGTVMIEELANAARTDPTERRYFLHKTQTYVFICAAMLDVCRIREFLDPGQYERVYEVLERILALTEVKVRATRRKRA
jgi:hypothetical protein